MIGEDFLNAKRLFYALIALLVFLCYSYFIAVKLSSNLTVLVCKKFRASNS